MKKQIKRRPFSFDEISKLDTRDREQFIVDLLRIAKRDITKTELLRCADGLFFNGVYDQIFRLQTEENKKAFDNAVTHGKVIHEPRKPLRLKK